MHMLRKISAENEWQKMESIYSRVHFGNSSTTIRSYWHKQNKFAWNVWTG